jgi:nucleotide-binding universal stress UspA family protein
MTGGNDARHLTVGVQDAQRDRMALRWACAEAAGRGLALHVVHAYEWQPGPVWAARLRPIPDSLLPELRAQAESVLAAAVEQCRAAEPALTVTGGLIEGLACDVLYEQSLTAELLVVAGHPRSSGGIGSVAQGIGERSTCPIVVVRDTQRITGRPARVLVGLDLEGDSDAQLAFGFEHAQRWGAALEAVTCWRPTLLDAQSLLESAVAWDRAAVEQELCAELAPWLQKYPEVETVATVCERRPVAGLIERSDGHDLLVLGRPGSHPIRAALGSVHLAALRQASCPVALVPTERRAR